MLKESCSLVYCAYISCMNLKEMMIIVLLCTVVLKAREAVITVDKDAWCIKNSKEE